MSQQILDRDRPHRRYEVELAVVLNTDLLIGKFRDVFRNGVVEQEIAFLEQHHDSDGDDRLCHREGVVLAGFCLPSASNQAIWPRRATIMVTPGMAPLSMSRL